MWITARPGIQYRHQKACKSHDGGKCRCQRSWRARYKNAEGQWRWSPTFDSEEKARAFQARAVSGQTVEAQTTKPGRPFNEMAEEWFELAKSGAIAKKGGNAFSKGTLDTYGRMYGNHVRVDIGKRDASKLTAKDWQLWLDALVRKGLKRNSVSVTLNCVRAIYRYYCSPTRLILTVNATRGLELPANNETARDRVAVPEEARALLAALKNCDRVAYALSLYAGLRNVERRPLDWSTVEFGKNRLGVRDSKSDAGIRWLPITAPLRLILREEWMRQGRPATGLVVKGPKGGAPEYDSQVTRAKNAWAAAGLDPIGFHECRHTYISTMIAAGLNAKAVSTLAGHASIQVTFDKYGHLFAGHEDEAGRLLDAFYVPKASSVTNDVTNEAGEASDG